MQIAVIDLGTNTFNLAIGSWINESLRISYSTKEGVALGMGGINDGLITTEATQRAILCLKRFKLLCDEHKVSKIHAIGTSAIRDAKNSEDFCDEIFKQTGIRVEVIDGLREAELIFKGIACTYSFPNSSLIIGGGSTEFIQVEGGKPTKSMSLNIGVSRIFQRFHFSDPLNQEDIRKIEDFLEENCDPSFFNLTADVLVGASGSFETFFELVNRTKFPDGLKTQEVVLSLFLEELEKIITSTQAERDVNSFIIPIRKKMAPIAAVKTRWVIKSIGIKEIVISPCSLKEGVFSELKEFS
jgi:exopolyphosphatase/guanosine-5'-triphosphate,3'-diphosphate pyrophosphatase